MNHPRLINKQHHQNHLGPRQQPSISRLQRPLDPGRRADRSALCRLALTIFCSTLVAAGARAESYARVWARETSRLNDQPPVTAEILEERREGFLGCIFSPSVCNDYEVCFDDLVFGRCISVTDDDDDDDLIRFPNLSDGNKALISFELKNLDEAGLDWDNVYTQCILQNIHSTIRYDTVFDQRDCDDVFMPTIEEDLQQEPVAEIENENEEEQIPEDLLAILSSNDGQEDIVPKKMPMEISSPDDPLEDDPETPVFSLGESPDRSLLIQPNNDEIIDTYLTNVAKRGSVDIPSEDEDDSPIEEVPVTENDLVDYENYLAFREALSRDQDFLGNDEDRAEAPSQNEEIIWPMTSSPALFYPSMTHDVRKTSGKRNLAGKKGADGQLQQEFYDQETMVDPSLIADYLQAYSEDYDEPDDTSDTVDYYADDQDPSNEPRGSILKLPLTGGLGSNIFNRNERLDVKKPGPFYPNSANNFFLDKLLSSDNHEKDDDKNNTDVGQVEYEMPLLAPVKDKRDLPLDQEQLEPLENQEPEFVHIKLDKRFNTYQQGEAFIHELANEFGIPPQALTDKIIEDHHVQFHVNSNPQNINAIQMAKRIDQDGELKSRINNEVGVQIGKAAAGRREDVSSVLYPGNANFNLLILIVISVSTCAALLVIGLVTILVKRRARVGKLRRQDLEEQERGKAQEEYQQLCRDWSRSSKKVDASAQKAANSQTASVKKQSSGNSDGSNRSSTSSWSEEPNTTNMDISTGHMVLAYMEDHLKNKQRLEQEWVALCSYEAEPCATTIAFKAENKKKNRYPDKLPYDHNRVILNAMVNGTNSDYINASTITDHDPRNPSYIVTQAPLANSVADFWQMIWEQGCVVIVMLTRLQDNGHQLCQRYWPEEGSEQYHIFEVHLVSEHVWCDDYLVRSVYLKNTRTGETRTVTQFHFRSWPAHGIPTSTKALLEFRRKVNKSYRGRSCPIAVHCSDGVGRSGTYVLIDMVLNRMSKGCKEIDIAASLEHIRDQRGGMVQTRQQFEFCLMAVAEEVHAILKALPQ